MDSLTRNAMKSQGLDRLKSYLLWRYGIETEVENTGGHCMALVTYVLRREGDVYYEDVIVAAGEGDGTYHVNRFPVGAWMGSIDWDLTEFEPEKASVYGIEDAGEKWANLAVMPPAYPEKYLAMVSRTDSPATN